MGLPPTNGAGAMSSNGGQPDSFKQSNKQSSGRDPDINPQDVPPGGPSVFPALDPKGPDTGNPIGTVAGQGGRKPFKGI